MKGYRGRAKLPVFKFYKGYPLVKIFVDNGTDTPKSAIYLDLHLVHGVVGESGTVEELHFEREVKAPELLLVNEWVQDE
jgi:hypothetical protein